MSVIPSRSLMYREPDSFAEVYFSLSNERLRVLVEKKKDVNCEWRLKKQKR